MARYHINPDTGNANQCNAKKQCRFGDATDHYDSKLEAQQAYEKRMDEATQALQAVQKEISEKREEKTRPTFKDGMDKAQALADKLELPLYQLKHIATNFEKEQRGWDENEGIGSSDMNIFLSDMANYDYAELEYRAGMAALLAPAPTPQATKKYTPNGPVLVTGGFVSGKQFVDEDGKLWAYDTYTSTDENGNRYSGVGAILKEVNDDGSLGSRTVFIAPEEGVKYREYATEESLQEAVDRLKNTPRNYGFPEDEMSRYNLNTQQKERETYLARIRGLKEAKSTPAPVGEAKWDGAIVAERQFNKLNPGEQVKTAAEAGTMTVVVPNVKRMTDAKKLEVAEELYRRCGYPMEKWEQAPLEEKMKYANSSVHRYNDVELKNDGGKFIDLNMDNNRRSTMREPNELFIMEP